MEPAPTIAELQARRAAAAREVMARTGIDEAMIERLVGAFYGAIRKDAMLGPIFAAHVDDWDPHLERMCAFWSSVVLMTGRYHGRPTAKHAPLAIGHAHFEHWLALFRATAREVCPPAAAEHFIDKAERIADSLERAVTGQLV